MDAEKMMTVMSNSEQLYSIESYFMYTEDRLKMKIKVLNMFPQK